MFRIKAVSFKILSRKDGEMDDRKFASCVKYALITAVGRAANIILYSYQLFTCKNVVSCNMGAL